MLDRTEKSGSVVIEQVVAGSTMVFGLGNDQKVYFWDTGSAKWFLYV